MSNSAFITLAHDAQSRGVYFDNNTGHGFVQVAIEETRRRFRFTKTDGLGVCASIQIQNDINTFYTVLYGVIREYQLYFGNVDSGRNCSRVHLCSKNLDAYVNNTNELYIVDNDFFCDKITGIYNDVELSYIDRVRDFYDNAHTKLLEVNALHLTSKELYTNIVNELNSVNCKGASYFMVDEDTKTTIIAYFSDPTVEICISYIELYINEYVAQHSSKVTDIKPWDFKYTFS